MKKYIYAALIALVLLALVAPQIARADEKFTVHGEVRFRGEVQENAQDFDDDDGDDSAGFFPYRIRLAAEGKFSKNVVGWIEFQQSDAAGEVFPRQNDFIDNSEVFLYQGNVTLKQLWSKDFSLRIGRQEIVAGNELMLGDEDFYAGISHDGGVGMWDLKNVDVMVWFTKPVEGNVFNVAATPDRIDLDAVGGASWHFAGGYANWTFNRDQDFDVYLMNLAVNGGGAYMNVQTIGVRYARDEMSKDGFIWNIEVAQQAGDAAVDVDASGRAIEGWFGYNWKKGSNTHRVYARVEQATGDEFASADDNEGFIPMFGENHNRTGRGDWFQLANNSSGLGGGVVGGLMAVSLGYNGFYNDRHEFGAAFWDYSQEEDNGGDDALGTAFDVWYGFNYSRNVNFTASVSQFSPDDGLTGGGGLPDDAVTRLYGQVRLRF